MPRTMTTEILAEIRTLDCKTKATKELLAELDAADAENLELRDSLKYKQRGMTFTATELERNLAKQLGKSTEVMKADVCLNYRPKSRAKKAKRRKKRKAKKNV